LFFQTKDVQKQLAQLILLNGFQSCPDTPGTEKVVCSFVERSWLVDKPLNISAARDMGLDQEMLNPQSLFYVKGWNRSLCCLAVLFSMYEDPTLLEARIGFPYFFIGGKHSHRF
jgi:hypothetical protein